MPINRYTSVIPSLFGPLQISVFRSRSAMLNELKLVCGFVQYPRTFVPQDCLDSTMAENRENNCYDRQQISFPSLLLQGDHPTVKMFPAEPPEYRDTTVQSNSAETTAIVRIILYYNTKLIVITTTLYVIGYTGSQWHLSLVLFGRGPI